MSRGSETSNACECTNYKLCNWSFKLALLIGDLGKQHPQSQTAIRSIRQRICDARNFAVYCCGQEAPSLAQIERIKNGVASGESANEKIPDKVRRMNLLSTLYKKNPYSLQNSGLWKPDLKKGECGQSLKRTNIFGGEKTLPGEITFMALMGVPAQQLKSGFLYYCGGSIINKWYILTAAHCFFDRSHQRTTPT